MKKSETKSGQFRQGDVFFKKIDGLPKINLEKKPLVNGKIICGEGEKTNHFHAIPVLDNEADLYVDEKGERFLHVKDKIALSHEEHDTIADFEPNSTYKVIQQREYHPEQIRNVLD